jgi:serine/threonine protein kinase
MLNWSLDEKGRFRIERVVLSDLDCALKLKGEKLLDHRMGNVMWRSPEGQTGKGIGKPSEVFSFGLVVSEPRFSTNAIAKRCMQCLYTITGAETLHPDFEQLKKEGTEPELVILYKLLSIFGPLPQELITHVNDEYWAELLTALSQAAADEDPGAHFEQWDENTFPNLDAEAKRVISRMTNLDPKKRATMDQILEDPWWK